MPSSQNQDQISKKVSKWFMDGPQVVGHETGPNGTNPNKISACHLIIFKHFLVKLSILCAEL